MRFLLYNIRYATGPRIHGYMRNSRRNLDRIAGFLGELQPDLIGLVEIDQGSYRSGGKNQVELLAEALGHYHSHSVKYDFDSLWRHVPVLKQQGNAFLARDRIRNEKFHYFKRGMKRLAIELELEHLVVYLVHLSIGARARHDQLTAGICRLFRAVNHAVTSISYCTAGTSRSRTFRFPRSPFQTICRSWSISMSGWRMIRAASSASRIVTAGKPPPTSTSAPPDQCVQQVKDHVRNSCPRLFAGRCWCWA
ncbi:MAG: hypothetical protein P8Y84_01825 [Desulfuromonadales bacterium]